MNFILVALLLNAVTGEPMGFDRINAFTTPEACIAAMNEGLVSRITDGKVKSYLCVREDALGEVTT